MNIALWIIQGLLAVVFLMSGSMKLITPVDELIANGMGFVASIPTPLVRFIGISEVAGALGLFLPALLRIRPVLTPIAATALALVMFLAICTHIILGEATVIGAPILLGALSAFVAWGRFGNHAIGSQLQPRIKAQVGTV